MESWEGGFHKANEVLVVVGGGGGMYQPFGQDSGRSAHIARNRGLGEGRKKCSTDLVPEIPLVTFGGETPFHFGPMLQPKLHKKVRDGPQPVPRGESTLGREGACGGGGITEAD